MIKMKTCRCDCTTFFPDSQMKSSKTETHKSSSMEIIRLSTSDSRNVGTHPTPNTPIKHPRRRSTSDGPIPQRKRIAILPSCVPAFYTLKQELRLRSDAEILHWLIHQAKPHLVPAPTPPNTPPKRPTRNSVSTPLCMQFRTIHNLASASSPPPRQPIRATVVQASTVFFDTLATLDKAERLIAGAAAYGSQLVVFPEAFIGGYPRCSMKFDRNDLQKYRASAVDVPGPEIDRLAKMAGKYKVHLVMGVVERTEFSLFSTLVFFNSSGSLLGKQRKLMLMPSETAFWRSGRKHRLPVFNASIGKIGGLICWDNKSPFRRSELYANGVELYCAPSTDAREVWKASVIHIAVEGCCFVLSSNQFSRREDYPIGLGDSAKHVSGEEITCSGGSIIVSPSGNILAGPNYQGECLLSADLDIQEIVRAKMEFGVVGNGVDVTAIEDDQSLVSVEVKEVPELILSSDMVA